MEQHTGNQCGPAKKHLPCLNNRIPLYLNCIACYISMTIKRRILCKLRHMQQRTAIRSLSNHTIRPIKASSRIQGQHQFQFDTNSKAALTMSIVSGLLGATMPPNLTRQQGRKCWLVEIKEGANCKVYCSIEWITCGAVVEFQKTKLQLFFFFLHSTLSLTISLKYLVLYNLL